MSYYPPNYKIEVKVTYSDYDTGERKELFAYVSCQELNSETEILRYFKAVLKELQKTIYTAEFSRTMPEIKK